jgi:hypothetical protein
MSRSLVQRSSAECGVSECDREASKGEIMTRSATRRKDRKKENKTNPRYSPPHTPTYLIAGAVITAFLIHLNV